MTIEFKQTKEHLIEFNDYLFSTRKGFKRNIYFIKSFIIIAFFIFVNYIFEDKNLVESNRYLYSVGLTILFSIFIFRRSFISTMTNTMLKSNPQLIGDRKLEIIDNNIIMEDGVTKSIYDKDKFLKKVETKNLYLFFINENMALIIPKDAFDSKNEELFMKEVF